MQRAPLEQRRGLSVGDLDVEHLPPLAGAECWRGVSAVRHPAFGESRDADASRRSRWNCPGAHIGMLPKIFHIGN